MHVFEGVCLGGWGGESIMVLVVHVAFYSHFDVCLIKHQQSLPSLDHYSLVCTRMHV